jgi:hypothetical protein
MAIAINGGSSKEGDGDGKKGGGRATAMATAMKRAMAMAMRVAGDEEGNCNGGKSNCDFVEGGGQSTATRAMVTRVAAERWQRGRWRWR